jgi:putative endonuclease
MFYVYFQKSLKNGDLYIGSCEDIEVRVNRHNKGLLRSTKTCRPWVLVGSEEYQTRSEAFRREMFLKTGQQKELLKKKFC